MANKNEYEQSKCQIKLEINNIPAKTVIKNVFSTNIFIPMKPNLTDKSLVYYCGFIKLLETYKIRTRFDQLDHNDKWYLYVYMDDMFFEKYDDEIYESRANNNADNKKIKELYQKNKESLLKIRALYDLLIREIRENHNGRYNFIRIFRFNFLDVYKKNKGYLGHPSTLGSIIRSEPLYGINGTYIDGTNNDKIENYGGLEYVFLINCNHAITFRLMKMIYQWIESNQIIILHKQYPFRPWGEIMSLIGMVRTQLIENKQIGDTDFPRQRILAGLFGYKINNETYKQDNKLLDYKQFIQSNRDDSFYSYGFDEVILTYIFKEFTFVSIEDNNWTGHPDVFYISRTIPDRLDLFIPLDRNSYQTKMYEYADYLIRKSSVKPGTKSGADQDANQDALIECISIISGFAKTIIKIHTNNYKFISRSIDKFISSSMDKYIK